ncbi:hypothetical protein BAUCODRAFT_160615 [Baudoinia panamericana UAMH 10762]|uniref:Methyltransferase domain-containing protein n=1 Tax=Baudoinia panamericana (strain UAMH 10762) TaxID=717646 RepID=M2ML02_BAUPA|nr:uncharacterized protein BAUCODRAFT_160615 [Baudoinia panamericana UAMH 10762]EMC92008.1 hypothetical protein BAUCODRAFT_160615 [Baudoinia panamericana UAMH 10762]
MHGTARLVEVVDKLLPFTEESSVLDVGCGTGSLTVKIHEICGQARILATDVAEGMLAEVNKLHIPHVTTQFEDGATLAGLKDASFTHGLSSFATHIIPDAMRVVKSLHRVVMPGGVVGIAIWGEYLGLLVGHERACRRLKPEYTVLDPKLPGTWYAEEEHRKALQEAGVKDVKTELFNMPLFQPADGWSNVASEWWTSTNNPFARGLIDHWVDHGGSKDKLAREFERAVCEDQPDGIFLSCVVGWGRK